MNPGGDIGKTELPPNIRNKFTEIYIPEIEERHEILDFVS